MAPRVTHGVLADVIALVPADWLADDAPATYVDYLSRRCCTADSRRRPSVPEPERKPFSYAILRVVPRVERGERFNAGVVLFCRQRDFLGIRISLDERRLSALAPDLSAAEVRSHLDALVRVAEGDRDAGPIAAMPASERFGWLVAPSSTIVQPSKVHTGLSDDPGATLDALYTELVAPATNSY